VGRQILKKSEKGKDIRHAVRKNRSGLLTPKILPIRPQKGEIKKNEGRRGKE